MTAAVASGWFAVPDERSATEPPESRGTPRDQVRLLVAEPDRIRHARFAELPAFLRAGDLVVINTTATLAAALDAHTMDGHDVAVHVSTILDDGAWAVEIRRPDATGPDRARKVGDRLELPAGVALTLAEGYPDAAVAHGSRLWRAAARLEGPVHAYLERFGRPITYGYVRGRWPLESYQPVFARESGSAEMASASRPFTDRLVTELITRGVTLAPVTLHTGVSSQETGEPPLPERFRVPEPTAALVEHTRRRGGRVIAVGTTVVRALESAATPNGHVEAAAGWTDLVLGPGRPAQVVDGLVTGWHAPEASHLHLLEAVAGERLVRAAYEAALQRDYLWHEFGDSCLLLPRR